MWNPWASKSAEKGGAMAEISRDQLTLLAIEHWRLETALAPFNAPMPARHAVRKIGDLLKALGFEARSLDGQQHDPGMSASVIDRVVDPSVPPGQQVIVETVSPLVTLKGNVIKPAEVVVGAAS